LRFTISETTLFTTLPAAKTKSSGPRLGVIPSDCSASITKRPGPRVSGIACAMPLPANIATTAGTSAVRLRPSMAPETTIANTIEKLSHGWARTRRRNTRMVEDLRAQAASGGVFSRTRKASWRTWLRRISSRSSASEMLPFSRHSRSRPKKSRSWRGSG
jgi:hypothetical protein